MLITGRMPKTGTCFENEISTLACSPAALLALLAFSLSLLAYNLLRGYLDLCMSRTAAGAPSEGADCPVQPA